MAFVAWSWAW
jgi:hypothetical protein